MSRYFIAPETAATPTPTYDYTSSYSAIQSELNDIDIDTTSLAASIISIATSLSTIATNSTTITSSLGSDSATISGMLASLTQALENIESHQRKIRELGEGPGIRMVGPYEWLGFIPSYINYIEKGEILDTEGQVSAEQIATALTKLKVYFDKINSLPTNF